MTGTDDGLSTAADERWWGDRSRYDDEPAAVIAKAAFGQLMRVGSPDEVLTGLEIVWMQVDRAGLWLESHIMEWSSSSAAVAESTCLMTLAPLALHLRAISTLGRADLSLLPVALMASRSVFEIGLRIAWIYSADEREDSDRRALRFRLETEKWMRKIASRLAATGSCSADRWREAANGHRTVVDAHTEAARTQGVLRSPPQVLQQLQVLGLEHLYHSYQLASAQGHGSVASGGELQVIRRERSPYGLYWPQDWAVPVNLCAWGSLFVAQHYPAGQLDVGPIRGLMWAANLLADLAPGPDEGEVTRDDR